MVKVSISNISALNIVTIGFPITGIESDPVGVASAGNPPAVTFALGGKSLPIVGEAGGCRWPEGNSETSVCKVIGVFSQEACLASAIDDDPLCVRSSEKNPFSKLRGCSGATGGKGGCRYGSVGIERSVATLSGSIEEVGVEWPVTCEVAIKLPEEGHRGEQGCETQTYPYWFVFMYDS